jgi:DNA-directed RNA polymerase subunit beta'
VISEIGGVAEVRMVDGVRRVFITESRLVDDNYDIPASWTLRVAHGDMLDAGEIIAENEGEVITARHGGRVVMDNEGLRIVWESKEERDYDIPAGMRLLVEEGAYVNAGDQLTEGSKNPHRILEIQGRDAVTQYLLREVQQVYRPQGQNISDKHFEVIIRKMLSKVIVTHPGDTEMLPGELIETNIFIETNDEIAAEGGEPAKADPVLMGITKASLNTESFLSASSFQHTIRVLAGAAIAGKEDQLLGLKENVIIGKLIPAGTGFRKEDAELEPVEEEVKITAPADLSGLLIDDNTDEELLEALAAAKAMEGSD